MRLIAIVATGTPAEPIEELPEPAREVGLAYRQLYATAGYHPPWSGYFALLDGQCVGTCGYKSPPLQQRVEIAYFTFPGFEGQGIATRMARALRALALEHDASLTVAAQTLPVEGASTRILRKLGFHWMGSRNHPEDGVVWEWQFSHAPAVPLSQTATAPTG